MTAQPNGSSVHNMGRVTAKFTHAVTAYCWERFSVRVCVRGVWRTVPGYFVVR